MRQEAEARIKELRTALEERYDYNESQRKRIDSLEGESQAHRMEKAIIASKPDQPEGCKKKCEEAEKEIKRLMEALEKCKKEKRETEEEITRLRKKIEDLERELKEEQQEHKRKGDVIYKLQGDLAKSIELLQESEHKRQEESGEMEECMRTVRSERDREQQKAQDNSSRRREVEVALETTADKLDRQMAKLARAEVGNDEVKGELVKAEEETGKLKNKLDTALANGNDQIKDVEEVCDTLSKQNLELRPKLGANDEKERQRDSMKMDLGAGEILAHFIDLIRIDYDPESADRMVRNCNAAVRKLVGDLKRVHGDVAWIREDERRRAEAQLQHQQQPRFPDIADASASADGPRFAVGAGDAQRRVEPSTSGGNRTSKWEVEAGLSKIIIEDSPYYRNGHINKLSKTWKKTAVIVPALTIGCQREGLFEGRRCDVLCQSNTSFDDRRHAPKRLSRRQAYRRVPAGSERTSGDVGGNHQKGEEDKWQKGNCKDDC